MATRSKRTTNLTSVAHSRLPYQPALDGLRGVAVAGVVAFHLGYLQGGFLGVDLFFTLSGYLITRLLLIEHENTNEIKLGAFWSRRLWRLLPALFLVLAAVSIYAVVAARPDELNGIRESGFAALFYVANWQFIATGGGYWDLFAAPTPFDHLWSLAIEEQFYVLWPLVFVGVLRFERVARRRRLSGLLGVTVVLAVASSLVLALDDPARAYLSTLSRSSSILLGAALAIVVHRGDAWLPRLISGNRGLASASLATAYLTWSWIGIDGADEVAFYQGGFFAHALAVCVLIAFTTQPVRHPVIRPLTSWPVRRLGTVSYGLYLWHWPVIVVVNAERIGYDGVPLLFTRLVVTIAVTVASYAIVEQPTRLRWALLVPTQVVVPLGMAAIAVALLAATVAPAPEHIVSAAPSPRTAGPSAPPPTQTPHDPAAYNTVADNTVAATETTTTTTIAPPALVVTEPATLPGLRTPTVDDPLRVLLIGDSYLYDTYLGIEAALLATNVITVNSAAKFGFSLQQETAYKDFQVQIDNTDPDLVVTMWARFDVGAIEEQGNNVDARATYGKLLDEAFEILTSQGATVAVIGLAPSLSYGIDPVPVDLTINDIFVVAAERAGDTVFYLNPDPIVAPNGEPERWIETEAGKVLVRRIDVSHYCAGGAARFGLAISELVATMTGSPAADPANWWDGQWRNNELYDMPAGTCAG